MASYTTGNFLRLLSECGTGVYKYPTGAVYPTRTAAREAILPGNYNSPNTADFFFLNIVSVKSLVAYPKRIGQGLRQGKKRR